MSPQITDEMIDILKNTYESEYQRYYHAVHRVAVEYHEKDGGTRKIIAKVEEYRNRLFGQLNFILQASIKLPNTDVFDFFKEQERQLLTEFSSGSLFGVYMFEDGKIYGGDMAGNVIVKDQEAWREAEKFVEERRELKAELKAERTRRQEAPIRL